MSTNKTAADMLLKLARDLEKEAAEKTIFACSGCGDSHSMATINEAITKFAEENPDVDTSGAKVTVNDTVSCPNCGHKMEYVPTAESEQYYVPEETEGDDEDKAKKKEDAEKNAAVNLDKITQLLSQIGKPVLDQIRKMTDENKLEPARDNPRNVDKHRGVDFSLDFDPKYNLSPSERAQADQLYSKLKSASDFADHEAAGLGSITAKVIFAALMAASLTHAGGDKHKALSFMDSQLRKADMFVHTHAEKGTPEFGDYEQTHIDPATGQPVKVHVQAPGATNTAPPPASNTAQAPTIQGTGHNASVRAILRKASADPKVNLEKLARYLA